MFRVYFNCCTSIFTAIPRYTISMNSNRNPASSTASRARNRHNNKVSRYSDSFHWPGRTDLRPRSVSSNHMSSDCRDFHSNRMHFDDYDPYSRLNFRVNNGGMRLTTSAERKRVQDRLVIQRVFLAFAALAIVMTGIGMMWMHSSNNAALASELLAPSTELRESAKH